MKNIKLNQSGSILIWTMLIGSVLLTSTFFFILRQNMNSMSQIETIKYQNSKAYLESYANFIMSLNDPALEGMKGDINYGNGAVSGSISQNVNSVIGFVDSGDKSAEYQFTGNFKIQWNKCSDNNSADIMVFYDSAQTTLRHNAGPSSCSIFSDGYYDTDLSISVNSIPFSIQSLGAPTYYQISRIDGAPITEDKWHLNLTMNLGFGDIIEINKVF